MENLIYKILEGYNVYVNEWYSKSYSDEVFITVNIINAVEDDFYDDNAESFEYGLQFDIWGKEEKREEVKKISKEIYKILKKNDFCFEDKQFFLEEDTQIYRESYRFNYLINMEDDA